MPPELPDTTVRVYDANFETYMGQVPIGVTAATRSWLHNIGQVPAFVSVRPPMEPFSFDEYDGGNGVTLAPGESVGARASVTPTMLAVNAYDFASRAYHGYGAPGSDSSRSEEVRFYADAIEPLVESCLFTSPRELRFGVIGGSGDTEARTFTVGNCSATEPVTVSSIDFEGTGAFLLEPGALPFTLAAGETREVEVTFTRAAEIQGGAVDVTHDAKRSLNAPLRVAGSSSIPSTCIPPALTARDLDGTLGVNHPGAIAVARVGANVEIDSRRTLDPKFYLGRRWEFTASPADPPFLNSLETQTFEPGAPGVYTVAFSVYHNNGAEPGACPDTSVDVYALSSAPWAALSLSWETAHDLDLHVVRAEADGTFTAFDPETSLSPARPRADWGAASDHTDDGFHLGDGTRATTESAILAAREAGRAYRVYAVMKRANASTPATFDVELAASLGAGAPPSVVTSTVTLAVPGDAALIAEVDTNGALTTP